MLVSIGKSSEKIDSSEEILSVISLKGLKNF